MEHNFSKNSDENELDTLLDNIFAVCDNEMGWSCEKPSEPQETPTTGNANLDFIRKTIDDVKDSLEVLYNNMQNSVNSGLDTSADIISLLSIQANVSDLNEKIASFQNSVSTFTIAKQEQSGQSAGNMQAVNDIISIL